MCLSTFVFFLAASLISASNGQNLWLTEEHCAKATWTCPTPEPLCTVAPHYMEFRCLGHLHHALCNGMAGNMVFYAGRCDPDQYDYLETAQLFTFRGLEPVVLREGPDNRRSLTKLHNFFQRMRPQISVKFPQVPTTQAPSQVFAPAAANYGPAVGKSSSAASAAAADKGSSAASAAAADKGSSAASAAAGGKSSSAAAAAADSGSTAAPADISSTAAPAEISSTAAPADKSSSAAAAAAADKGSSTAPADKSSSAASAAASDDATDVTRRARIPEADESSRYANAGERMLTQK